MKTVSLCAGVGISDRCFAQNGAQILVANDIHAQSLKVYEYNHQYEEASLNPKTIAGDLIDEKIQKKIIDSAREKLGDEPLDLLTAFLPPSKSLKDMLLGISRIATSLKAKLIFIDALPQNQYSSSIKNTLNLSASFYLLSASHALGDYGVPNNSKRDILLFLNKDYFTDENQKTASVILNSLPTLQAPTLRQLFSPIETAKSRGVSLPLHIAPLTLADTEHKGELLEKIKQVKEGETLFKKGINSTIDKRIEYSQQGLRAYYNKPLQRSLSAKAAVGLQWMMHPEYPRGFTPLEVSFLATLHTVPFEIAPDSSKRQALPQGSVMMRLAGCTAPNYLIQVIQRVINPIQKLASPDLSTEALPLKDLTKYAYFEVDGTRYYAGSCNEIQASYSKTVPEIFHKQINFEDNQRKEEITKYRRYLFDALKRDLKELNDADNVVFKKVMKFIGDIKLGFSIAMRKDVFNSSVRCDYKIVVSLIKIMRLSCNINPSQLSECENKIDELIKKQCHTIGTIKRYYGITKLNQFLELLQINQRASLSEDSQVLAYSDWKKLHANQRDHEPRRELSFFPTPQSNRTPVILAPINARPTNDMKALIPRGRAIFGAEKTNLNPGIKSSPQVAKSQDEEKQLRLLDKGFFSLGKKPFIADMNQENQSPAKRQCLRSIK